MHFQDFDPIFWRTLLQDTTEDLLRRHEQLSRLQSFLNQRSPYSFTDAKRMVNERLITVEVQMALLASEGRLVMPQAESGAQHSWLARLVRQDKTDARNAVA